MLSKMKDLDGFIDWHVLTCIPFTIRTGEQQTAETPKEEEIWRRGEPPKD